MFDRSHSAFQVTNDKTLFWFLKQDKKILIVLFVSISKKINKIKVFCKIMQLFNNSQILY